MKRSKVRLTDPYLRTLGVGDEASDADVPGLKLRVLPSGRREWSWRGGVPRRRVKLSDDFPKLTLAAARDEARALRGQEATGGDPAAAREAARQAKRERAALEAARAEGKADPGSFASVAELYLRHAKRIMRPRTFAEESRKLAVEVLPTFGALPIAGIRRSEVVRLLEVIRDDRGGVCSNRTRSILSRLFNFAAERELVPGNPTPRKPLHEETERTRVLGPDEIRAVWQALAAFPLITATAWRLILLTAQRPGEVLSMRWSDLYREGRETWWTIPATVAKNGIEHRVLLTPPALALVEALRPLNESSGWVLCSYQTGAPVEPGGERVQRPMRWLSHSTPRLRAAVAVVLGRQPEPFTPHDCRRTAATLMGENGVRADVVERVLGHVSAKLARTYNRSAYDLEKRQALVILGDVVERIAIGAGERDNLRRIG